MAAKHIYRIHFINAGHIYEIYAKKIAQSNMFGFIEIQDFIFNTKSTVVVDPSEERLKTEFAEVTATFIPINSVIRIDQVKKEGAAKIHELSDKTQTVRQFPNVFQKPSNTNNEK